MKLWKKGFSLLLLLVATLALMQSFSPAKIERSKVIKKDFDAKEEIIVGHEHGPLTIKKSADGRNHLSAEIIVTGTDEESMEEVMNRLDVAVNESGSSLELTTKMGIQNWTKINDRATIKFCDGSKVKGISDFKVNLTLFVADPKRLKLSNKYDRIDLPDDYNGELAVNLYSGDLATANLGGSLDLELKYSKGRLKNIGKANLEIYDSELNIGNLQSATVSSKYSEFVVGEVAGDLTLQTYDENWRVGSVGGLLTLEDKYSEFRFGNVHAAAMQFFDAEFGAENMGEVDIRDTKYSEYKITSVGNLKLGNVFDDDYKIKAAKGVTARDSKYTEYDIEKLEKVFDLNQSFDDAIELGMVAADFSTINLDGKYTEMALSIAEGAQFEFIVDLKYGSAKYPDNRLDIRKHLEKDSQTNVQGFVGAAPTGGETNRFQFKGFDNTLNWH